MRCEAIEVTGRPRPQELICAGCGCTEDNACEGGCFWVSFDPPVCSACMTEQGEPGADEAPGFFFFGAEQCPASLPAPAVHVPIWLDETSGYCARCRLGFAT